MILEVAEISKNFGGIAALNGVTCAFRPGEIGGIIGPNGAGKTTLFNVVTGYVRPDTGHVHLDGVDLTARRAHEVAKLGVARSFQAGRLFEGLTVMESVTAAIPAQLGERLTEAILLRPMLRRRDPSIRSEAESIIASVGLESSADARPSELSNAERRLLVVARLLAARAQVMLLDEPLAGLDSQSIDRVAEVLVDLRSQGRTIVLIEHNFAIVRLLSDVVTFMAEGSVVFVGKAEEITEREDLTELYFGKATV